MGRCSIRSGALGLALAAGVLITAMLGVQSASAESRMALVIGQSAYRAVTPLPNPVNDAAAMAKMLGDAGFEVQLASDLTQNELRQRVADFAATVAAKGPDTVSLMFYAGHGLQVDGENYLMPIDIDPKRETDIPLQAVRLNDVLNTLTAVPARMRIILLDACRNNPFPEINKTAARGLAQLDVKFGAPGTWLSYSTSPGAEAEDGTGANSPYTTALLEAGREPGRSIEDAFKRVRLSVNKATEGRQTPWESSSLVSDFRFFSTGTPEPVPVSATSRARVKRTAEQWRGDIRGKTIEAAHDAIIADGSVEAYEAFVASYNAPPFSPQAREWLDRHYRMVAWNNAVILNTAAGYRAFLVRFPDSDLTATALRLEERMRNRPLPEILQGGGAATALALAAPTCPCSAPDQKKAAPVKKRAETKPPRRAERAPMRDDDEEVVVVRRPPPAYYPPVPGPYIGGGPIGTIRGGGGGYRPPRGDGGYGQQSPSRGRY